MVFLKMSTDFHYENYSIYNIRNILYTYHWYIKNNNITKMFTISLIENITEAFIKGDTAKVTLLLQKEAVRSRNNKKSVVGKRLENLTKKIPSKTRYSSASLSGSKHVDAPKSQLVTEYSSSVTLDEVVLNSEVEKIMFSFFKEWKDYERLLDHGLAPANKILLYGAPGTGKTKLAYAIANQLGLPLVLVRLDELISSFLGKTGKNIREIFELANERRVVIFLDEIDTVAKHRADEKELGELKRIVTVLLQNIDLFPPHSIIIGATNHEDILDKAIWRRFPLKLKLEAPSTKGREKMLLMFLGVHAKELDMKLVLQITEGLSGSEIYDLCQQSLKEYIISGEKKFETKNFLVAYFQLMVGSRQEKELGKRKLYQMAQELKDAKYSFREIESITMIPYTTLKDNIS